MEFKFDLLEKENVGTISLSDKVRISDPCYDMNTWCAGTLDNVLQGTYNCYSQHVDTGDWGIRVASIEVRHEDYTDIEPTEIQDIDVGVDSGQAGIYDLNYFEDCKSDKKKEEVFYDTVCGLTYRYFDNPDYVPFNKSSFWKDDFEEIERYLCEEIDKMEIKNYQNKMITYYKAENKYEYSIEGNKRIGRFSSSTLDGKCLVSSSGYGDGGYTCLVGRNANGKIVSIKIDYYYGYDKDDECDTEV